MQMVSGEARRRSRPSVGQVPEKTPLGGVQGWGLRASGALHRGHSQDPLPSQEHRELIIPALERPVSLPWGGRGRQLGVCFNKALFSFILPYLHPGFPRKAWLSHCTGWPLQENAIGPSYSKS